jgi:hypothetical protein
VSVKFCSIYLFIYFYLLYPGHNKRIFVYEDEDWIVKGRFETAQHDTDPIQWTVHENKYVLPLLLVSPLNLEFFGELLFTTYPDQ